MKKKIRVAQRATEVVDSRQRFLLTDPTEAPRISFQKGPLPPSTTHSRARATTRHVVYSMYHRSSVLVVQSLQYTWFVLQFCSMVLKQVHGMVSEICEAQVIVQSVCHMFQRFSTVHW